MAVASPFMAGACSITPLVAPPKFFSQSHLLCSNSRYYHPKTTANALSFNQTVVALPRLSISTPPPQILSKNNESRLLLFREELQHVCLSAFALPPRSKTRYNNKSQFLSLALTNYYHDHESDNNEVDKEESAATSSALEEELKGVTIHVPSYVKWVVEVAFWGQAIGVLCNTCIFTYILLLTGLITSLSTFSATAGGTISAAISLYFNFNIWEFLEMEEQHIVTDRFQAPLRAKIMKHIKYTIPLNLLGLGATILGMQRQFGLESSYIFPQFVNQDFDYEHLVEFCRTSLLKGSKGAVMCHLLGLTSALVLLEWITKTPSENTNDPFLRDQFLGTILQRFQFFINCFLILQLLKVRGCWD